MGEEMCKRIVVMRRLDRVALSAFAALSCALGSTAARAEESAPHAVPLVVLTFDTPDAEEHAEALTGALRSRVRGADGFYLVETTRSLSSLTAAMGCAERPDAACEKKIAEHLKVDQFVWGSVRKTGGGFVTTEAHLFSKKRSDIAPVTEKFSDNLRDQNDDSLRKVATRILDRLDESLVGKVHLKVVDGENKPLQGAGTITIGGTKRVPMKNGVANLVLAPGTHKIVVSGGGLPTQDGTLVAVAGKTSETTLALGGVVESPKPSWFTPQRTVGIVVVTAGVAAGVASVVFASKYFAITDEQDSLNAKVPNGADVCSSAASAGGTQDAQNACQHYRDNDGAAKFSSAAALVGGGLAVVGIGVGAYLIVNGGKDAPAAAGKVRVMPFGGPQNAGLSLGGSF